MYNHSEWMKKYWKSKSKAYRKSRIKKAIRASSKKPRSKFQMKSIKKAQKVSHTPIQRVKFEKAIKLAHSLPRTEAQLKASAKNFIKAKKVAKKKKAYLKGLHIMHSLPRSRKQLAVLRKAQRIIGPSKIQLKFSKILKSYISYLRLDNYFIEVEGHKFKPDIVNLKTKRIVEIDGAHWHNKKKDRIRDKFLRKVGYKILHLKASKRTLFKQKTINRAISFLLNQ